VTASWLRDVRYGANNGEVKSEDGVGVLVVGVVLVLSCCCCSLGWMCVETYYNMRLYDQQLPGTDRLTPPIPA
jgi:hypothetical protein